MILFLESEYYQQGNLKDLQRKSNGVRALYHSFCDSQNQIFLLQKKTQESNKTGITINSFPLPSG
jgi:hypothetical protein